jgi:AraC family transcriptional regulator of adaptative response / DNA-3-methyladenine glycosylase II
MPPAALRSQRPRAADPPPGEPTDTVRLRLPYRPPFAWEALLEQLRSGACAPAEWLDGMRYCRTVVLGDSRGAVFVRNAAESPYLIVDLTVSLLPALMPLLARLHQLFDLDAEPEVVDAHLARAGLGQLIRRCPGLRVPGAFDGFEEVLRELLRRDDGTTGLAARVVETLGERVETGCASLTRAWPDPVRVLRAGSSALDGLGVPESRSRAIVDIARAVARGVVRLSPGTDFGSAVSALVTAGQIETARAEAIAMRALHWPDAAPGEGRESGQWRPWRSYAAAHLARDAREARHHRTSA